MVRSRADCEQLRRSVERELAERTKIPHRAIGVGVEIFLLGEVCGMRGDDELLSLEQRFAELVRSFEDCSLCDHVMRYAIRLASHESELIFEEMAKLYSLCKDAYALSALGYPGSAELQPVFEAAVRDRLARQPKLAKAAIVDDGWSAELWWNAALRN